MMRQPTGKNAQRLVLLLAFTLADISGQTAFGHDVWLTTAQDSTALHIFVHYGHPGDRKRPDPDKLFELYLFDGQDRASLLAGLHSVVQNSLPVLVSEPIPVEGKRGLWLVGGQYDNGYWVKTAQGYRNTSKHQVSNAEDSLSSMKCAKALISINGGQSEVYKAILGYPLELIPLANPLLMKRGETWPVQVLFEGRPLPGVAVEATDGVTPMKDEAIPRYQTNDKGIAEIPIQRSGPLLLVIDYQRPGRHLDEASVDRYNATFHVALSGF